MKNKIYNKKINYVMFVDGEKILTNKEFASKLYNWYS